MTEIASTSGPPAEGRRPRRLEVADLLRVSRAGLIVSHIWAYLLPTLAAGLDPSRDFWVGLVYVTVPLGLLIYGWNDYFDADVDTLSRRKSDRATATVFGPLLTREQRAVLPAAILAAQIPFALLWAATGRLDLVGWLALMAFANALYNGPGPRLSRVPVAAELTATGIYLLITWLGVLIRGEPLPAWLWLFAALSILVFQVAGTLVDRADDERVGKRTLSVAFGATTSRIVLLALAAAKAVLTWVYTASLPATGVMVLGVALLAARFSLRNWRASSTAYSLFVLLDWAWMGLLFLA